ncbi:MAG: histidine kinase [Saprospiraceae bacterium]|nr:histidine kinase [Lewinella sp.]
MQAKIGQLILINVVLFILLYIVREMIYDFSLEPLRRMGDFRLFMLAFTTQLVFILYSLAAYLLPLKLYPQHLWWLVPALFISWVMITAFRYIVQEVVLYDVFGFGNYSDDYGMIQYVMDNLYYAVIHMSVGFIFFFFQYTKFKDRQQQQLVIQNQRAELTFLRSQLNPHFLFNTLNNIYSLVYRKSDAATKSIEKLTAILRYALYEQSQKVPLKEEINSLQNFIELERIRYDYKLDLNFSIDGDDRNVLVPPFLLIPFIENVFKHGDLRKPICIRLEIRGRELCFEVKNAVKTQHNAEKGGIGLENIRRRLELLYPGQYELQVEDQDGTFTIFLKLNTES